MQTKYGNRPQYAIKKGDRVRITAQGAIRTGLVSTSYWSENGGYNIELVDERVGYTYWKQGSDGGVVQLLEVGPELPTAAGTLRTMRDASNSIDGMKAELEKMIPEAQWIIAPAFHDETCMCLSWDVQIGGWPTTTVYMYTFWNEDKSQESDLILVGEESMQMMDWVYGGGAN